MKRSVEYEDLTGDASNRFGESLFDRLDYCRAMLRVHGLITEATDTEIHEEITASRVLARDEHAYFVEGEEEDEVPS